LDEVDESAHGSVNLWSGRLRSGLAPKGEAVSAAAGPLFVLATCPQERLSRAGPTRDDSPVALGPESDETLILSALFDIRADVAEILWLLRGEGDDEEEEDA
jgi:hypothetical protein